MARNPATEQDVRRLMKALGQHSRGPGRVYFAGGATAVLKGWRDSTVDVDLKLDPEPAGVFQAIRAIVPRLEHFPGIDAAAFRAKLCAYLERAR